MKIKKIIIWQGRISNCCKAPVIKVDYNKNECHIWCGECGKLSGFEKIKQEGL